VTDPGHRLDTAPCGECRALVPRDTGCPHWRPEKARVKAAKARAVRDRINQKKRVRR
jgi:hypothetical protein